MQLPSFLSRNKSNNTPKQYIFALLLAEDYIQAAVWSLSEGKVDIISRATIAHKGEWEDVINAADKGLGDVAHFLPENTEVNNVIFGLSPQYVKGEKITSEYISGLKKLCQELKLHPAGFVVIPEALSYYLNKKDGTPPSVILLGIEQTRLTVSIFKVGRTVGMVTVPRTDNVSHDVEEALESFTDIEILPSTILLYDGEKTITSLRDALLDHPWQKKQAFLHFPKIECLSKDTSIDAVAIAGAGELASAMGIELSATTDIISPKEVVNEDSNTVVKEEVLVDKKETEIVPEAKEISEPAPAEVPEDVVDAQAVGFGSSDVTDDTIREEIVNPTPRRPHMEVVVTDDETTSSEPSLNNNFKMPEVKLPSFSFPTLPNMRFIGIIIIVLFLIVGAGTIYAYRVIPQAKVTLIVDPQILKRDIDVTLDSGTSTLDEEKAQIPVKDVNTLVSGTKSSQTTGEKEVGDKAKGEITVYNKTTNTKTFPKGTVITGPKGLAFTLNDSVSVASVSDVIVGTPGKATIAVTATSIGTESNIPSGSDFSFKDLPVTSYAARNDKALAGGTSHQAKVVAKSDQDELLKSLAEELKRQSTAKLLESVSGGEKLLEETVTTTVKEKTFNHEVGEEGDTLTLTSSIEVSGIAYKEDDVAQIIKKQLEPVIPEGFSFLPQDTDFTVEKYTKKATQADTAVLRVAARLRPSIPVDQLKKEMVGKSFSDVEKYLREQKNIVGFEIKFTKTLPFWPKQLPYQASNLVLTVESR